MVISQKLGQIYSQNLDFQKGHSVFLKTTFFQIAIFCGLYQKGTRQGALPP